MWYELEKTEEGIGKFLDWIGGFHDFRIERISLDRKEGTAEVFLLYDTFRDGVLLRFSGTKNAHISCRRGYEEGFIYSGTILRVPPSSILFIDDDDYRENDPEDFEDLLRSSTWVEAESLVFAITDGDGVPSDTPPEHLHSLLPGADPDRREVFAFKRYNGPLSVYP